MVAVVVDFLCGFVVVVIPHEKQVIKYCKMHMTDYVFAWLQLKLHSLIRSFIHSFIRSFVH